MTFFRLLVRSLVHFARSQVAVGLGIAAATAVLTGALLVGDSVRGSLRDLTLQRLGKIDQLLIVDRFFRRELAEELQSAPEFPPDFTAVSPAIILPAATIERAGERTPSRVSGAGVLGIEPSFAALGAGGPSKAVAAGQIVLNHALAVDLGVQLGDQITIRLAKASQVPADSPLGRKTERLSSLAELQVVEILPDAGLARFSLSPMQTAPRNAFVNREELASALEAPGKANLLLVAGQSADRPASAAAGSGLQAALKPKLVDLGLTLKRIRRTYPENGREEVIYDYYSLSSDRMLLDHRTEAACREAFRDLSPAPVLTYLANDIRKVAAATQPSPTNDAEAAADNPDQEKPPQGIPYSTITALDPVAEGPLVGAEGKPLPALQDDEIAINAWTAEDQGLKLGDRVLVTYFEPESTHGKEREATAEFRVAAIVPFAEPETGYTRRKPADFKVRPTTANDPDLTPEVKGVTDQASIADWDAPFPFDYGRIRSQDDTYWENHRTTPKAFVSLAVGQKLWGSRFGRVTSLRIPQQDGVTSEERLTAQLLAHLAQSGERLGMEFTPIKRRDLAASAGTTPFDVLFLLLSMFVIGAALLLVWLLFRLGVEQRADQIGLLLALGWSTPRVARSLLTEGLMVAALGAAVGVPLGCGYCWLLLAALRTVWVGAIATPFLHYHAAWTSLAGGFAIGVAAAGVTIALSLRGLRRLSIRSLLAGQTTPESGLVAAESSTSRARWIAAGLVLFALGLAVLATQLQGEAQAGAFLGAGALVLAALLLLLTAALRRSGGVRSQRPLAGGLRDLAWLNIGRNVSRSVATVALAGAACFLVTAVSAFRLDPTDRGVGGFDLLAESSEPLFVDLNDPAARKDALGDQAAQLGGAQVFSLRLKGGDDASCRNLYQASQPRVLGVPPALIQHFDEPRAAPFVFAASAAQSPAEAANPWRLLAGATPVGAAVPVVLDKNTAMYSLRLYRGVGEEFSFDYEDVGTIRFRVAGLLANSVLQGGLLVSEADFRRLFPQVSGYRSFLIATAPGRAAEAAQVLESKFSDEGLDCVDARGRLRDLLAVQNTYISTFQTLGGLGLALGACGLAAVQLRNVQERRKEFALLRAAGFAPQRLGKMVLLENLWLLWGGLICGSAAAAVAVLPHLLLGGAGVPLAELGGMLVAVAGLGAVVGLVAVRSALQTPVVSALRGD